MRLNSGIIPRRSPAGRNRKAAVLCLCATTAYYAGLWPWIRALSSFPLQAIEANVLNFPGTGSTNVDVFDCIWRERAHLDATASPRHICTAQPQLRCWPGQLTVPDTGTGTGRRQRPAPLFWRSALALHTATHPVLGRELW